MKLNEVLPPPQDLDILVEQQVEQDILQVPEADFQPPVSGEELLKQLGITQ